MRILLVHSPLVGPSTWAPVAEVLTALGHEISVPGLRAAAKSGDPYVFIDAARDRVFAGTAVIAGHSGAGFFRLVVARLRRLRAVPPCIEPAHIGQYTGDLVEGFLLGRYAAPISSVWATFETPSDNS